MLNLILLLILLPSLAFAQGTVKSRTQAGDGTSITNTVAGRLDVSVQSTVATESTLSTLNAKLPAAFVSADNITAQTATAIHGLLFAWDAGGGNWDRLLTTSGALHVNVQNASVAVTGTFWQATQPISGTVTATQATGTNLHMVCDSGCGSGTQYAEDTAHASGDQLTMAGVVQQTADTALSTEGDRSALQVDANGYLKVNIKAGAGSGGTAMTDDAAFSPGSTSVTPAAGMFDDVTPDSVNEGDAGVIRMSANRNVYNTIRDAAGNERGVNVTASNELNTAANTELPAAAALADDTANPTVPGVGSFNMCWDGATWDRCAKATVGNGAVDTATQRVTIANDSTGILAAVTSITNPVQVIGDVAHDAVATSVDPVLTGCYASAAAQTAVSADGDSVRAWCLRNGARAIQPTFSDVLASTGVGAAGTGSQRVVDVSSGTTGAAPPTQAKFTGGIGSGATGGFLVGMTVGDSFANINVSTATTTLIVTGVSGRHVRITGLNLVTAAANNVALISGTGATCGTGTTGMTGGTTAASGYNFAANGGIAQGSGLGEINRTNATGDSVCIITSAATQLSGRLSYAIY